MNFKKVFATAAVFAVAATSLHAQFMEDALRLASHNGIITPRVAGLNVAYQGIADDVGALMYNPAGLTLIGKNEVSGGFGFTTKATESDFLSRKLNFTANNEFISHLAVSSPIETSKRPAAVAIGYFMEDDYDNNYKYEGFNPNSTLIGQQAKVRADWVKDLLLSDDNFKTGLGDSLYQKSFVQESGGLHNLTAGAAFDLNDNMAIGFSLSGKWGAYEYRRNYSESDPTNIHNTWQVDDINVLDVKEHIKQDISGFSAAVGLQGRIENFLRFGINVKLPTWYQIEEDFSQSFNVQYDSNPQTGKVDEFKTQKNGTSSYNLRTPFIYSAGFSFHHLGATFAAGIEYSDVTQMKFSDGVGELDDVNSSIIQELTGQVKWGFGAEYDIPLIPVTARASFQKTTSPYGQDIAHASMNTIAMGASVYFNQSLRLDFLMRWSDISELRSNYGSPQDLSTYSNYIFSQKPTNISLGLSYRY